MVKRVSLSIAATSHNFFYFLQGWLRRRSIHPVRSEPMPPGETFPFCNQIFIIVIQLRQQKPNDLDVRGVRTLQLAHRNCAMVVICDWKQLKHLVRY